MQLLADGGLTQCATSSESGVKGEPTHPPAFPIWSLTKACVTKIAIRGSKLGQAFPKPRRIMYMSCLSSSVILLLDMRTLSQASMVKYSNVGGTMRRPKLSECRLNNRIV